MFDRDLLRKIKDFSMTCKEICFVFSVNVMRLEFFFLNEIPKTVLCSALFIINDWKGRRDLFDDEKTKASEEV